MVRQKKRSSLYISLFIYLFLKSLLVSANEVRCTMGFGSGAEKSLLPSDLINDNYCDCPIDGGIDEPNTSACSGAISGGWSGIKASRDYSPLLFQCRKYSKQRIPSSRLNDGICDCCDGSDEEGSNTRCNDTCDEIIAKENIENKRIQDDFQIGNDKLSRELAEYQAIVRKNNELIENIQSSELTPLQKELETLESSIQEEKLQVINQYFQKLDNVYQSVGAILPGDMGNLKMLIEAICHLQGEMMHVAAVGQDSCTALRLAGLDIGIIWQETQGQISVQKVTHGGTNVALDIYNILVDSQSNVSRESATTNHHPRPPSDETNHNDEDDHENENDEEEDDNEDQQDDLFSNASTESHNNVLDEEQFISIFEFLKRPFHSQAKRVLQTINLHLVQAKEITEDIMNVDVSELQKIRDKFTERIHKVELGMSYTKYAKKYLQSLEEYEDQELFKHDLIKLSAGTIYHSLIRGVDVVDIVSMYDVDLSKTMDTCVLPAIFLCPPKTKIYSHLISGEPITFPPESLLNVATTRCQSHNSRSYDEVCKPLDVINPQDIINKVNDNYFESFEHSLRDGSDFFAAFYSGLEGGKLDIDDIKQKQAQVQVVKAKIDDCEKRINDLNNETGKQNSIKYGPDGILFALRNKCFEVKNGKYIYEVCIFGNAYQREDDNMAQPGTGTSLGRWSNILSDEENARKIMKWIDGTGCWNGPSRSATVYISCGSDTVLLSADEPNTCEYVLMMQSHIACDDIYKRKYCSKLSAC